MRACKQLIADVDGREIDDVLIAKTVEGIADIRASDEGREGVQAFLQKRKPSWLETGKA
ncbi:enoyl-CoA hydratase [Mycobacterium tuberculosis]|nr:enoyl-CoA hydratase [Mycobacterium tuberculosis]